MVDTAAWAAARGIPAAAQVTPLTDDMRSLHRALRALQSQAQAGGVVLRVIAGELRLDFDFDSLPVERLAQAGRLVADLAGVLREQVSRQADDFATVFGQCTMTWTCMVCGEVRPDHFIGVAHRRVRGLEELFPACRVNVRYCVDRRLCSQANASTDVWPRPSNLPVHSGMVDEVLAAMHAYQAFAATESRSPLPRDMLRRRYAPEQVDVMMQRLVDAGVARLDGSLHTARILADRPDLDEAIDQVKAGIERLRTAPIR